MSTVRRLYFYGLSLVSLEVVIWGVVGLLRTVFSEGLAGGSLLATALSLVLVGLPIFLLHWRKVQWEALSDPVERGSRVRAVFLYAVLFGLSGSIVYALVALFNRELVIILGQPPFSAWFGQEQNALDNLIAMVVNGAALSYFWSILHRDWLANVPENSLAEPRRLFRYLWILVGLTLTVAGVYNILRYLLYTPGQNAQATVPVLAGGITFLVIGTPLWAYFWYTVQEGMGDREERRSILRLVVLYVICLVGVVGVLAAAGSVLTSLIRSFLGERRTLTTFLQGNSAEIGALIPLAVMWAYYGSILGREVAALPDLPRQTALRRLYYSILALLGLAVMLTGLFNLADALTQLVFDEAPITELLRDSFSGSLSAILVGFPLWWIPWRSMQAEAARKDDSGDHARRSVLRRIYLYLVIFALVVGGMGFAGQILFTLLNAVLSQVIPEDLTQNLGRLFLWLVIDAAFLAYHWRALRRDNLLAQQTLGNLHAAYPTLVIVEENGLFAEAFVGSLRRLAPRLPVAINPVERGAPDETMLGAKAVLIPVSLAIDPPEALRLWLAEYTGQRILIPLAYKEYFWLGRAEKTPQELAREAAQTVRQMAEGETVRQSVTSSPWVIAGYILGGLFGLQVLVALFSLMISALFR